MKILSQAVGSGAPDNAKDVARVRELLEIAGYLTPEKEPRHLIPIGNAPQRSPRADVDLVSTIRRFQSEAVQMRTPDGRIDPGGGTIGALVAEARKRMMLEIQECRDWKDERVSNVINCVHPDVVKGNIQKPHLIAAPTIGAIRMLGYCCGLDRVKLTEGIRTYEMMASYFLRKITAASTGVRGESYRHALEILKTHNGGKPYSRGAVPQEHAKAVADRMRKRCAETNTRVSRHVVTEEAYRKLNVVDLGYNSNPRLKEAKRAKLFARLLDSFHVNNKNAKHKFIRTYHPPHYLNAVLNSPYGRELRMERAWHIEFIVASIPTTLS